MRLSLLPHPDTPCSFADRLEVEVCRDGEMLRLTFRLRGDIARLRSPAPAAPGRREGLWRTTCFEAFVRPGDGAGYFEFNLSPSTEWAAYAFEGYREGMAPLEPMADPDIDVVEDQRLYQLRASLDLHSPAAFVAGLPWRTGLAAVIESDTGETSYWALAHPAGPPDFHHRDCFALQLPAARAP